MAEREALIAKASWWSGWCIDNAETLPELTGLGAFLMEVKDQMRKDRPPIKGLGNVPDDDLDQFLRDIGRGNG